MRSRSDAWEAKLGAALEKYARCVESAGPGCWNYTLSNGEVLRGHARRDGQWTVLEARPDGNKAPQSLWGLLELNGQLRGLGKFAIRPGRKAPLLLAEFPLDPGDEVLLTDRVASICLGFEEASVRLHGKPPAGGTTAGATSCEKGPSHGATDDLRRVITQAGWSCRDREDGSLIVDLPARRGFFQAELGSDGDAGTHLATPLSRFDSLASESREAIGLLLLSVCGCLRMARATAKQADARIELLLEARLPSPSPTELDHALSALSTGCDLCGPEVAALRDTELAISFMKARGWSPRRKPNRAARRRKRGRNHGKTRNAGAETSRHGRVGAEGGADQ